MEKVLLGCANHSITSKIVPRLSIHMIFSKSPSVFCFNADVFLKKQFIYICFK